MSVYVDALIDWGWKLGPSCHMIADTENELHEMAAKIGMKRSWFQNKEKHSLPHYDLVASRRKVAIAKGAIEIDRKELSRRLHLHRESLKLNRETAVQGSDTTEAQSSEEAKDIK